MSKLLTFNLKGERDYVQGSSLFNALVQAATEYGISVGKINVSFKKIIHNPVCVLEQRSATTEDAVVAKVVGTGGRSFVLCISEATETAETARHDFDEVAVCRGAKVGDNNIIQENPNHPDLIELVVSHCKKMHLECIDDGKKWVFSRYDGLFPIPKPNKLELRITKQIGTRLTSSDVLVDGLKVGNIYFS